MTALSQLAGLLTGRPTPIRPEEWPDVVQLAQEGRLEPQLLRAAGPALPASLRAVLEQRSRKIAFCALRALGERDRILNALRGANVSRPVLLKGAALGWLVYPDPLLRSANDLDLLIPLDQQTSAGRALQALGYREHALFANRPSSAARFHERVYVREVVPGRYRQLVELHTAFAQRTRHAVDYPAAIARALPFPQGGPGAFRLTDPDTLVHLAIHMAREQLLGPLKQLWDLHLWVTNRPLDWAEVIACAIRWEAATSLAEALRLTRLIFGTAVPDEPRLALSPRGLRGAYLRFWHQPGARPMMRRALSMRTAQALTLLPLLDTPKQRARFLLHYGAERLWDALPLTTGPFRKTSAADRGSPPPATPPPGQPGARSPAEGRPCPSR